SPLASSKGNVLYVFSKLVIKVFSPQRHGDHREETETRAVPPTPRGEGDDPEEFLCELRVSVVQVLHGWANGVRRPASSGSPNITLRHCTPWPAPPLTRLSIAAKTIAVFPSATTPMSTKFEPFTLFTFVVPLESRTNRSPG